MNKKFLISIVISLFISLSVQAQQRVTVSLNNAPLSELFKLIEQQTNYRIFCNSIDTKGVFVTLSASDKEVVPILEEAIQKTNLKISSFENFIFILKDKELMTELIIENKATVDSLDYTGLDLSLFKSRQDIKATSENVVYEIGDKSLFEGDKTITITGSITDFKTREPMVGISLFVKEPFIGTTTDAFGYYAIKVPAGRLELNIQGIGVKTTTRQIMAYNDGKLDIELEEQIHNLKEVIVSSERLANVRSTTMGLEKMRMKDIKNIPTAFGEVDIIRVVMSLPGVKAAGEISSGFNVRGGATDQNLILFNDGTIYNPTHLFGLFSVFNPDIVRDMEFYKSTIPSKYGGRISSVLEINSKEGNKKEFTGSASIGLLTSRLTLEIPLMKDRTSLILGGRTTYSDWLLGLLPEKSGYKDGKAGFSDFNVMLNHQFNERNNLYLSGYYSNDHFKFDATEKYGYQNANASAKWRSIINPLFTSVYTVGYDHYNFNTKDSEIKENAYKLNFGIDQFFAKADYKMSLNDEHTLSFGLNTLLYSLNPGKYLPDGHESLVKEDIIPREKALESAIYAGDIWDISSKFSVDYGVGLSMFNVLGTRSYNIYDPDHLPSLATVDETVTDAKGVIKTYFGPEVRLSARYAFTSDFSVKAGFNTMKQYIHKISNSTIMSPTDTWKLSDVNIKPQSGMQASLGLYKNFADDMIETSVEGYYKSLKDYLDYRAGAELVMNHHLETDVLNTEGRAYGVEVMIKKIHGKLNGWLSYTYSKTELKQNDERITRPINDGDWYPADFDKPHDVKLVANYKFTHRHSLSVNCEYNTGRPVTLPASKFEYEGEEYVFYSKRNQFRIPDYFRLDASFTIEPSHNLTLLTHSTISFGIYNITGRKNPYSVYYTSEHGKLKGYKMAIFGVPIPYISYNIKF